MERKELYAKIQQLGLQEEVKKTYGKNYTQVGNRDLEQIIWNYDATLVDKNPDTNTKQEENTQNTEMTSPYEAACLVFLGVLKDSGHLDELLAKL